MITLMQGSLEASNKDLFDQMYKLRARVFSERLGWDVRVKDGKERDEFDDSNPLYGIALSENGREVVGCFRLLQTTGPTMLGSVFRDLLPEGQNIRSPLIWESTRFCVDTEKALELGEHGLNNITGKLLAAVYETGVLAGLTHVVTVIDVRMERVMRRAGCPMDRLAPPRRIGNVDTVATLVPTTEEAVSQIHARNGIVSPCVSVQSLMALAA
ncbi:MAG: conjugal transfer protein TraI [Hyphomicrobium sp.]|nr:MAG: conjugal transfer protein TraI [Hyphomicrobium sp.]